MIFYQDVSFAVVVSLIFYDWSECVMSVLGTTKHSSCNCIDNCYIVLYCTFLYFVVESMGEFTPTMYSRLD